MQEHDGGGYLLTKIFSFFLRRIGKRRSFVLPGDLVKSRRLLLIDSGDVVDLLFAAPVINYFSKNHPDIRTMILVDGRNVDIVKGIMKVNGIITYERSQLRFFKADYVALIRKLRKQFIETAVLMSRRFSLERFLLAFACGANIRIGFAHPLSFPFMNCEIRLSEAGYEGRKMPGLLHTLGLSVSGNLEPVRLSSKQANHARQLIHFRNPEKECLMVGIDPSRSKSRHQVIPEILTYLANNLAGRRKVKFLVLADPWDERIVRKFSCDLRSVVIDIVPANVSEAVALVSQCDLFLSGNTNLFHYAAALQVPTIGLFTKYDSEKWVPESSGNVRIFKGTRGEKLSLKDFFSKVEEVLSSRDKVSV